MDTLGINAAPRDPAACLVRDGQVIAAAEEERLTRRTGDTRPAPFTAHELPFHAIDFCLRAAGITLADVDHVAYAYDPQLTALLDEAVAPLEHAVGASVAERSPGREARFLASIADMPRCLTSAAPLSMRERFRGVSREGGLQWHFVARHLAHAASAFLPSPFERAAVLTVDGRAEAAATGYALAEGAWIETVGAVSLPHSLGLLYEQVSEHLGLPARSGGPTLTALAPRGRPRNRNAFRELVRVEGDGRYTIAPPLLAERFGPARTPGSPLEQRHYDLARSLQDCLAETLVELAGWLHEATGAEQLCLAGELARDEVLNARLRDETPFRRVWAQPAAGDAGAALGAALLVDAQERGERGAYRMEHAFLGPAYGEEEIEVLLRQARLPYRRVPDIATATAELLVANKVVAWFQGHMEVGPRALGARSILASPICAATRGRLAALRGPEAHEPLAAVVLEEEADSWFVGAEESPFAGFAYDVRPERAGRIPAAHDVDGTAAMQTLRRGQHPRTYELLRAFAGLTGVPVLLTTSFNARGEPLVCAPRDALESLRALPVDALAIESFLVEKVHPR